MTEAAKAELLRLCQQAQAEAKDVLYLSVAGPAVTPRRRLDSRKGPLGEVQFSHCDIDGGWQTVAKFRVADLLAYLKGEQTVWPSRA